MIVRDLITALLKEDMDAEVKISYPKAHIDELGEMVSGFLFDIDYVDHWNEMTMLNFTDWRDKNE